MKIKEKISVVGSKIKENLFGVLFFSGIVYLIVGLYKGYIDKDVLISKVAKLIIFGTILFVVIFTPRRILRKNKEVRRIVIYIKRYYTEILHYRSYVDVLEIVHFFFLYTTFYLERILKYIFVGTKIKWLKPYRKNGEKGNIIVLIISLIYMGMHNIALYVLKIFYEVVLFFDTASIKKIIKARSIGIMGVISLFYIIGPKFLTYYIIMAISIYYIVKIKNIGYGYKTAREGQRTKKIIVMREGEIVGREDQEQNRGKALEEALISARCGFELGVQYSYMSLDMIRRRTVYIYSILNIPYYAKRLRNKYKYSTKMQLRYFDFNLRNSTLLEGSDKPIGKYKGLTRFGEKEFGYTQEAGTYGLRFGGFERNIEHFGEYETLLDFQIDIFVDIYLTKGSPQHYEWMKEWYLVCCRRYFEFNDIVEYVKRLENIVNDVGGIKEFYNKYFIQSGFIKELSKGHREHKDKRITTEELSDKIDGCYRKLLRELKMIM